MSKNRSARLLLDVSREKPASVRVEHGKLKEPGKGIIFAMDICYVVGEKIGG